MKVFPLLSLDYDDLRKAVLGMDISESVSLAMMSSEIRKIVRMRDNGDVKITTTYHEGKCTIEVQYEDGTSSKMLLYECKKFPSTNSVSYNIGGFPFHISKTVNSCVIYTGENPEDASLTLLEHLLAMFKSSKVHLDVLYITMEVFRKMRTSEAFNYVHLLSIESGKRVYLPDTADEFENIFLDSLTSPPIRLMPPEYRTITSENRFRTDSAEAWVEDLHNRQCPKIEPICRMNAFIAKQFKSIIQSWQQGATLFHQNMRMKFYFDVRDFEFAHALSIFDGHEDSICWDTIGKREEFDKKPGFCLARGSDLTRQDGDCLSLFLYRHSRPSRSVNLLELVIWKPVDMA